jgi:hypothetical protein
VLDGRPRRLGGARLEDVHVQAGVEEAAGRDCGQGRQLSCVDHASMLRGGD